MKCNNKHCMWSVFDQCCPEDAGSYKKAVPNTLDCPSSLRVDFQGQLSSLVKECKELLNCRNMKELLEIKRFIESQRN